MIQLGIYTCVILRFVGNDEHLIGKTFMVSKFNFEQDFSRILKMVTIEKWGNLEKCYYCAYTCVVPPYICNNEHLIAKKNIYCIKIQF